MAVAVIVLLVVVVVGVISVVLVAVVLAAGRVAVEVSLVVVILVAVVMVLTVVARSLVCDGAVIGAFIEVLAVAMRLDVLIIASKVVVGFLMDALTAGIMRGVRTSIGVDVLIIVNVNAFAGVMTAFEIVMLGP